MADVATKRQLTTAEHTVRQTLMLASPYAAVGTVPVDDPSAYHVAVDTNGSWFAHAGWPEQARLRVELVGCFDRQQRQTMQLDLPGTALFRDLPAGVLLTVSLVPLAVVVGVGSKNETTLATLKTTQSRVITMCITTSFSTRAMHHLLHGRRSLALSIAAVCAGRFVGPYCMVWSRLHPAAQMMSMPRAWRLFHLRYVVTGLYNEQPDSKAALVKNTMGVVNEEHHTEPHLCAADFETPIEHALMLACAPHSYVVAHDNHAPVVFLQTMAMQLSAIMWNRGPYTISAVCHQGANVYTAGNGVACDLLFRFARAAVAHVFVCLEAVGGGDTWWFIPDKADTADPAVMRAFAVSLLCLFAHTGMGPGLRLSYPFLIALAGLRRTPAPPDTALYVPAPAHAILDLLRECSAEEIRDMSIPSRVSGDGWALELADHPFLEKKDEADVLRRMRVFFWNAVVAHPLIDTHITEPLCYALGGLVFAGVTTEELSDLLRGPPMCLDVWRRSTGVRNGDESHVNTLFDAARSLDVERLAVFWTAEPTMPCPEAGTAYACTLEVVDSDCLDAQALPLPMAHTCTRTLEIHRRHLVSTEACRSALQRALDLITRDGVVLYGGE